MKKIYFAPELETYKIKPTDIIATSTSLGDGSTDTMYSKLNNIDMSEHYDYDDYFDIDW